jgi:hypothetical protein
MVLIEDDGEVVLNLWYPLVLRNRKIRVAPWERYRKWLPLRASLTVVLIGVGLAMLDSRVFSEALYNLFALLVIFSASARLRLFFPKREMMITRGTPMKIAPVAVAIESAGGNILLGLMCIVFATQPDPGPFGVMVVPGFLFVLFGLFALLPGIMLSVTRAGMRR